MTTSPNANRLHISIFGKTNSGKSTLINSLTNQNTSLVSDQKGTTTDPVQKAMEIKDIGPCLLIDTAGFDDTTSLGKLRVDKTKQILDKTDIAILLICDLNLYPEKNWIELFNKTNTPFIIVVNDFGDNYPDKIQKLAFDTFSKSAIIVDAHKKIGIDQLISQIAKDTAKYSQNDSITKSIVKEDDVVMLVMPQDIGAPKGRLILPQVQTTRDLLDNQCIVVSVTADKFPTAISTLKTPPTLIITDSQVFNFVYKNKPKQSRITSFSVLFASYKGDINAFLNGIKTIDDLLTLDSVSILIAESCTHKPQNEDIGRVKIPKILDKMFGDKLSLDIVSGSDFPDDISHYDLIIHCGGCMFNRKFMLSRINKAVEKHIPITNYGIFLAYANGILDKISFVN